MSAICEDCGHFCSAASSAVRRQDRKNGFSRVCREREWEECGAFTPDVSAQEARIQAGISLTPGQVVKVVPGCGSEPVTGRLAVEAA